MTKIKTILWETPRWTPHLDEFARQFHEARGPAEHAEAAREIYDILKLQGTGVIGCE